LIPLSIAEVGEVNTIKRIGATPDIKKHLSNLGFVVGSSIVIVNTLSGNLIVNIKDSRVALSREMAEVILV
jgi:ferrous iron transport protein A